MSRHPSVHNSSIPVIAPPVDDHILDQISDKPLFPLNIPELQTLGKIILQASFPAAVAAFASNVNAMVCLKFIAGVGDAKMLAGASLASTWAAAFCLGIVLSINLGFAVFAAQAYGAQQYRRFGILYQRNLFVLGLIGIPLLLSLLFAESILNKVGLDPEVSVNVGIYLKYLIPSLVGLTILETTKSFMMAQNIFTICSVIQVTTAFLNYFWCYLFTEVFELSLKGVGIAKSITDISGAIALILYARYSGNCTQTWIPWTKEALDGWWEYLKATATIGANLYIEWISYEVSILIAGALNDAFVTGAHGLAISIQIVVFCICLGNMVATQTFAGNAVGAGHTNKAKKVTFVAFVINSFYVIFNIILLIGFGSQIAAFFTSDPEIQRILTDMLFYYGVAHFFDSYGCHIGAILRSIGMEREVLTRFIWYCTVALNLEWIFGIALGYSYKGIWWSMTFGMIFMFTMMCYMLKHFDWDEAVYRIRQELKEKEHQGDYVEMKEKAKDVEAH